MATQEAIWLEMLNKEITGTSNRPIQMYCDNKGAIDLAKNNNCSAKTKHIDIKLKFVHDEIEKGLISLNHVPTNDMLADVLTKTLPKEGHYNCINNFGF